MSDLFAVFVLHRYRMFTRLSVRSGIVSASFVASNETKNHDDYYCYCWDAIYQHVHYLHLS